jgi:hypothetical protein
MADGGQLTHLLGGEMHVRREAKPDDSIAALTTRQQGVADRGQLIDLGISSRSVDCRLAAGTLRPLHPGVYAVGHEALPFSARALAAVLSCAPDAVASHWTVAALRRLCAPRGLIHVTATGRRAPAEAFMSIAAHCRTGTSSCLRGSR